MKEFIKTASKRDNAVISREEYSKIVEEFRKTIKNKYTKRKYSIHDIRAREKYSHDLVNYEEAGCVTKLISFRFVINIL